MQTLTTPGIESPGFRQLVRESHRRQFNGEDAQTVAVEISQLHNFDPGPDSSLPDWYNELESSPYPGCECGFCATAEFQD